MVFVRHASAQRCVAVYMGVLVFNVLLMFPHMIFFVSHGHLVEMDKSKFLIASWSSKQLIWICCSVVSPFSVFLSYLNVLWKFDADWNLFCESIFLWPILTEQWVSWRISSILSIRLIAWGSASLLIQVMISLSFINFFISFLWFTSSCPKENWIY